jgi:hypothetical protein
MDRFARPFSAVRSRLGRGRTRRRLLIGSTLAAAAASAVVAGALFAAGSSAVLAPACSTPSTLDASGVEGGQSNFEIDAPIVGGTVKKPVTTAGANLTLDGSSPCLDWTTKAKGAGSGKASDLTSGVIVKEDKKSGAGDDSFGQGTSETNPVPTIVSGSIPPNKSDLQDFGVYRESNASGKFLDLFWSRVNSPSGTVDMDFELNKLACDGTAENCANNGTNSGPATYVTPKRSVGDRLVTYDLANGGTVPTISIYKWNGSGWTEGTVISGSAGEALGSINFSSIASIDAAGLGTKDPFTFGEVSVSYKALFSGLKGCGTFGSVYLKSRSSNTFTDELKDFVAPEAVQITNCTTLSTSSTNQSEAQTLSKSNTIGDTATLSGASSPTGTITFKAYGPFDINSSASGDACVDEGASANLVFTSEAQSLSGPDASGNYTAAASFVPKAAGRYQWVASYSGDPNNAASNTACGDEHEASLVKENPAVSTKLSASAVDVGTKVHDSATLSVSSPFKPSGEVTYSVYTNETCTTLASTGSGGQLDKQPGSVEVNADGTVPDSAEVTFQQPGTYYWQAAYGGDSNYNAAKSECTSETLVVNKLASTISTAQSWFPQDTATIDHSGGTVVFTLLKNVTNTTTCSGGSTVYGPTAAIAVVDASGKGSGPFTASTANTTFSVSSVAAGDTYYWKAQYTSGDANHKNVTSACQESTGFSSLSNGSAVTSP